MSVMNWSRDYEILMLAETKRELSAISAHYFSLFELSGDPTQALVADAIDDIRIELRDRLRSKLATSHSTR